MLKDLRYLTRFVDGLRVTDEKTLEVVEMVLSGSINKEIVKNINDMGGQAIGLSGKDGRLLTARKVERQGDRLCRGDIISVNVDIIKDISKARLYTGHCPHCRRCRREVVQYECRYRGREHRQGLVGREVHSAHRCGRSYGRRWQTYINAEEERNRKN